MSLPLQNPEHLLLFAAGNDGDVYRLTCTIGAPGIGKNVLSIGATSSGSTRRPFTLKDDGISYADIDTVAVFSSYGFTNDNRIKPEVVAPGDQVKIHRTDRHLERQRRYSHHRQHHSNHANERGTNFAAPVLRAGPLCR